MVLVSYVSPVPARVLAGIALIFSPKSAGPKRAPEEVLCKQGSRALTLSFVL